jgi:hypothetical protein
VGGHRTPSHNGREMTAASGKPFLNAAPGPRSVSILPEQRCELAQCTVALSLPETGPSAGPSDGGPGVEVGHRNRGARMGQSTRTV